MDSPCVKIVGKMFLIRQFVDKADKLLEQALSNTADFLLFNAYKKSFLQFVQQLRKNCCCQSPTKDCTRYPDTFAETLFALFMLNQQFLILASFRRQLLFVLKAFGFSFE